MNSIVSWVFAGILMKLFVHVTKIPISLPPMIQNFMLNHPIFIFGSNFFTHVQGVKDFLTSIHFCFEFLVPINCSAQGSIVTGKCEGDSNTVVSLPSS